MKIKKAQITILKVECDCKKNYIQLNKLISRAVDVITIHKFDDYTKNRILKYGVKLKFRYDYNDDRIIIVDIIDDFMSQLCTFNLLDHDIKFIRKSEFDF